jgi:hypothetical protein
MEATSIPVSCGGVKTHVFMDDLVVDRWASDVEGSSFLDFPFFYTTFGRMIRHKITSAISTA